jgi:hypothetical protein
MPLGEKGRRLAFFNYHSNFFHGRRNRHEKSCRLWSSEQDRGPPDPREWTTLSDDALKKDLAEAMSAVEPELMRITYDALWECSADHGFADFDPSATLEGCLEGKVEPTMGPDGVYKTPNMRELLMQKHGTDVVLGAGTKWRWSQKELVAEILARKDEEEGWGGFVTIRGGVETVRGGVPDGMMGFCLQRCPVKEPDIGDFTRFQMEETFGEAVAAKKLRKMSEEPQTLSRQSFHSVETIGLGYFRWLIRHRGLEGYKILHFMRYEQRFYLRDWVTGLLQRRRTVQMNGGSKLEAQLLKVRLKRASFFLSILLFSFPFSG